MERYVNTTYRFHDLNCIEWYYEFISMYLYSLSVCRISVFNRRAWNAFCPESLCPQALQTCCDKRLPAFLTNLAAVTGVSWEITTHILEK